MAIFLVTGKLFYDSFWACVFMLPVLLPYCRKRAEQERERKSRELTVQFRDALGSLITALRAGYSAENAFRETARDMTFQFGRESLIAAELTRISHGIDNRIPLDRLLQDFADRSGAEEIAEFAQVFAIARKSGGNMCSLTTIVGIRQLYMV